LRKRVQERTAQKKQENRIEKQEAEDGDPGGKPGGKRAQHHPVLNGLAFAGVAALQAGHHGQGDKQSGEQADP
jgi:hypothetical protein